MCLWHLPSRTPPSPVHDDSGKAAEGGTPTLDAPEGKDYPAPPLHETPEEGSPAMPAMLPNDTTRPNDSPMRDTADEGQTGVDSGETATTTTPDQDESGREGKLRLLNPLRRREKNTELKENIPTYPA